MCLNKWFYTFIVSFFNKTPGILVRGNEVTSQLKYMYICFKHITHVSYHILCTGKCVVQNLVRIFTSFIIEFNKKREKYICGTESEKQYDSI